MAREIANEELTEGEARWSGPRLACDLPIEREGTFVHNELVLAGWALSPSGISGVIIEIGDHPYFHASYGLDTPWLAESLPDVAGSERAGYRLQIDTSDWTPGPRHVTITVYDQDGRSADLRGEIEVVPFREPKYSPEENRAAIAAGQIAMWLERPSPADSAPELEAPVEIAGWAYAADGIEAVLITLDGHQRSEALHPVFRPDLVDEYGEEVARQSGFVLRLHARDCPPGWHRLSVVATNREGDAVGLETNFLCLPEPEPAETPVPAPGEAMPIDWLPGPRPAPPRLQAPAAGDPTEPDGPLDDAERELRGAIEMWRDRALLAEADAAASRNQANTARMHQEATLQEWRDTQRELSESAGELRAELEQTGAELAQVRTELDERTAALQQQTAQLDEQTTQRAAAEQRAIQAEASVAAHTSSLSWRITRPLRAIKRVARRARHR